jgi:hypothetical protein
MDLKSIIKQIIHLPLEFGKIDNNLSFYTLLRKTGYFDVYTNVTINAIVQELPNHQHCIEYWLIWSENKRSSDGRYFIKKDDQLYIVGRLSADGNKNEVFEFDNAVEACSAFIKREIECVRAS